MSTVKVVLVTVLAGGISIGAAIFGQHWLVGTNFDPLTPARGGRADTLPDFRLPDLAGREIASSSWAGQGTGDQLLGVLVPALRARDADPDPGPAGL